MSSRLTLASVVAMALLVGCAGSGSPKGGAGGEGGDSETGGSGGTTPEGGRGGSGGGGRGGTGGTSGTGGAGGAGGTGGRADAAAPSGQDAAGGTTPIDAQGGAGGADASIPPPQDAGAPDQGTPAFTGNPFVYVGTGFSGTQIRIFQLDMQTGALAMRGTANSATAPTYMAFHPTRKFAYALSEADPGRIVAFSIDAASGGLTQLNQVASGGDGPAHLSIHKSGKWLFVAHYNSGHISVVPVGNDGRVAAPVDVQKPVGSTAHGIIEDPSGQYVFMSTTSNDRIFQYKLDQATGKLTPNTPPSVPGQGQNPRHIAFHPNGKNLYAVGEGGGGVTSFDFNPATGLLSNGMVTNISNDGSHVQVHPSGKFVFVSLRGGGTVNTFTVDASGRLKAAGNVGGLSGPWDFAVEPTGKYLLVAHGGGVRVYAINQESGALTAAGAGVSGGGPHYVGVSYPP